jgi:hypothetical protein
VTVCLRIVAARLYSWQHVFVSVSVFQGYLGIPTGGFPEPLRTRIIKDRTLPGGKTCFDGRPGVEMKVRLTRSHCRCYTGFSTYAQPTSFIAHVGIMSGLHLGIVAVVVVAPVVSLSTWRVK